MKKSIFILLLLAFFSSCQKSGDSTAPVTQVGDPFDVNNIYNGQWQLLTTANKSTGVVTVPVDQILVEFNTNGTYKLYTNSVITKQDNFTIQQGKSFYTTDLTSQIVYANTANPKQSILVAKKDTLLLVDESSTVSSAAYVFSHRK